jgi:hypothetical protein
MKREGKKLRRCIIAKFLSNIGRSTLRRNFDVTTAKHAAQRDIFGTTSAFAPGPRKITENLIELANCRTFRMQTDF